MTCSSSSTGRCDQLDNGADEVDDVARASEVDDDGRGRLAWLVIVVDREGEIDDVDSTGECDTGCTVLLRAAA